MAQAYYDGKEFINHRTSSFNFIRVNTDALVLLTEFTVSTPVGTQFRKQPKKVVSTPLWDK